MYPHLYQKLKKAQMEEERCCEIERDNRTLVRRMTEIMQRSAIDTRNAVQYKSLNRNIRRKELVRITQENQALLKRIQQSQPTYNHMSWEQQRERSELLCQRICRYPYRPARGLNREFSPLGITEGLYYDEQGIPVGYPQSTVDRVTLPPVGSSAVTGTNQTGTTTNITSSPIPTKPADPSPQPANEETREDSSSDDKKKSSDNEEGSEEARDSEQ